MVEIQSCAGLVNASALCAVEQESNGDTLSVIAQMSDELERERQKNAALRERISFLEAKLAEERVKGLVHDGQGYCCKMLRSFKRLKRSKEESDSKRNIKYDTHFKDGLVCWMSMDSVTLNECEISAECVDREETASADDRCNGNGVRFGVEDREIDENTENIEDSEQQTRMKPMSEKNEARDFQVYNGLQNILLQRKPPKIAFCPKEVKGIIESEVLVQKNAQSHTMRKIIVFACLGIRHGCEEMYELHFSHFSIRSKGEPFISPQNPGEHVLYENPGMRRKIFYPNRQNRTLCPIQILEEEKAMRPLEANCPSCLFLCIKYGGRTRNLPQNEYVRQRMGRNKMKSFGPLMCKMAMLANLRSGSFFFKALGITLLFMAGFPDELVRRETKYRNFDLLQKYYRTDKDAEGDELFFAYSTTGNIEDKSGLQQLAGRSASTKSKGKKQSSSKSAHKLAIQQSSSSTQLGLLGYTSIETRATAAFPSHPSPSNPMVACCPPYNYFPLNPFVPMIYWPSPTSFNPGLPPCAYTYHSFPSTGNHFPFQTQPYCSNPCSPFITKPDEKGSKNDDKSEETDGESDSNSDSKDQSVSTGCKQ